MSSRKSEAELSRIQVDTEAAWFKIKADLEANMKGIMETRLASLPGGKDGAAATAVRKEVEARLAKIREDSFELAKPNLTVNGFPYETYVSTTEPWDEALDRKVWALESERVSWEATLAELRRKTPGQIREREEDLELRRARAEWLPEGEDDEDERPPAQLPPPERHEVVKETFNKVVADMSEVVQSTPSLLARAQRANNVREELAHMPR